MMIIMMIIIRIIIQYDYNDDIIQKIMINHVGQDNHILDDQKSYLMVHIDLSIMKKIISWCYNDIEWLYKSSLRIQGPKRKMKDLSKT